MIEIHSYDQDRLEALSETSPDELGRAIAEKITSADELARDLIRFTQHLQVSDPEVRALLSKALFQAARVLRDRDLIGEEQALWAAIRMGAVLTAKPEELGVLVEFLGSKHSSHLHQVSLQAIGNVSRRGPLPNIPELRDLATLVEFSANHFCHRYLFGVPRVGAIAIASVVAARAMGMEIEPWRSEFREHSRLLLRQLDHALTDLTDGWPEEAKKAAHVTDTERNRSAVLAWLEKPHHRQMADLEKDGGHRLLEWICTEIKAQDARLEAAIELLARSRAGSHVREDLAYQYVEDTKKLAAETPGLAHRRVRRVAADPGPRQRPRLAIGQEFEDPTTLHRWRVTDVGTRTVLAVDLTEVELNHPGDPSWLNGPPYAVVESPWDEYDILALQELSGIEWEDALSDPCPAPHAHSGGYHENRYACEFCGKVPDMTGKCTACRGQGKVMGDCGDSPNVWYDPCKPCNGTGNAPIDGVAPCPPSPFEVLMTEARRFAYDWRAQEGSSTLDALADAVVAYDVAEAAGKGAGKL